jgi:hypothetical protein
VGRKAQSTGCTASGEKEDIMPASRTIVAFILGLLVGAGVMSKLMPRYEVRNLTITGAGSIPYWRFDRWTGKLERVFEPSESSKGDEPNKGAEAAASPQSQSGPRTQQAPADRWAEALRDISGDISRRRSAPTEAGAPPKSQNSDQALLQSLSGILGDGQDRLSHSTVEEIFRPPGHDGHRFTR